MAGTGGVGVDGGKLSLRGRRPWQSVLFPATNLELQRSSNESSGTAQCRGFLVLGECLALLGRIATACGLAMTAYRLLILQLTTGYCVRRRTCANSSGTTRLPTGARTTSASAAS